MTSFGDFWKAVWTTPTTGVVFLLIVAMGVLIWRRGGRLGEADLKVAIQAAIGQPIFAGLIAIGLFLFLLFMVTAGPKGWNIITQKAIEAVEATPATSATATPGEVRYHTVSGDESLSSIAGDYYGDIEQWPKIATANGIFSPYIITPGQVLVIP